MAYVTCINHVGGRRSTYGVRKLFSALCKRPKWNEETDCRTKYEQLEWFEPKRKTHNCRLNCQTNWPTHIVKDQIYVAASSRFPLHQIRKKKRSDYKKTTELLAHCPHTSSQTHTHTVGDSRWRGPKVSLTLSHGCSHPTAHQTSLS